ncbi:MAG: membrane protein insertase YidC [Rhodospirillales bacterium]|nr:membrane protein insertase YidC [Rhodospirillales bacterium]MBO6787934.1 membrane protein insertase YidC [Rhodospirillales bacterium]
MSDHKNMILAIVLSIAILVLFETFFNTSAVPPEQAQQQQAQQQAAQTTPGAPANGGAPQAPAVPGGAPVNTEAVVEQSRQAALGSVDRVDIDAPRLHGSISLKGGLIDDLTMINYHKSIDPTSPEIVLLSPRGSVNAYYAGYGWTGAEGQAMPDLDTVWTADKDVLTADSPVTLSWDNGQGLIFKRTFSIDQNYMFTVDQSVENTTGQPLTLYPYGLLTRYGTPETTGFYILHEGLLGVIDGQLKEVDYDEISDEPAGISAESTGGWIGITDKYWLATLIPNQAEKVQTRFLHRKEGVVDVYQTDFLGSAVVVPAGGSAKAETHLFAGAKEVHLLDGYAEDFGIKNFDLAIDFGWFYFLTKPIFLALLWIHSHVGNLGVAILLLTVAIKIAFFPLANKSYVSMSKMKKLQPDMVKLRERYAEDKVKLNQEMMALYKREKVNPASGCLPILVQIPVFFALYKVLFVTIEMRHAPFFGWIQDLSAPDPTTIFNLFGLIPWTPPDFLMIGVWPLIMGASMYIQQKLNPQPADPIQAKIFLFMPLFFMFLLANFPAGLVIYWAWNNVLSILQQWVIMRRMGIKAKQALS